jgi:hypothetical protein
MMEKRPNSAIQTRSTLNLTGCSNPDCGHDHSVIYFHSHCHPKAALWPCYIKDDGVLVLECSECETLIAAIQVAP